MNFSDPNFKKETSAYGIFILIEKIFNYIEAHVKKNYSFSAINYFYQINQDIAAIFVNKKEWLKKWTIYNEINRIDCAFNQIVDLSADYEPPAHEAKIFLNNKLIFYAKKLYSGLIDDKTLQIELNEQTKIAFEELEKAAKAID